MFHRLKIHNYILIEEVEIQFSKNFNIITGETGAGKSVLMGALFLILGQRAESDLLKNKTKKGFIEAEIHLQNSPHLKKFFKQNDLDFEPETILRREINPNGKSRAFINDTPVVLKVLEQFSHLVFDLHSQDENNLIKNELFRLNLIDTVAQTADDLKKYKEKWATYQKLNKEIQTQIQENNRIQKERDFIQYQFQQLENAQINSEEQAFLEEELEKLNHSEEIKQALSLAYNFLSESENSVISQLSQVEYELNKLSGFFKKVEPYIERIKSNIIDLQDLAPDLQAESENIDYNPSRIEEINQRLNLLVDLQKKHQVDNNSELLKIKDQLDFQLQKLENFNFEIEEKNQQLKDLETELIEASNHLTHKRKAVFEIIEKDVRNTIKELGMAKGQFSIQHREKEQFEDNGKDEISFLFTANQGMDLEVLDKVASGGEISRLMLALKKIISQSTQQSTLILDEIDTGVSGEIADKMGELMRQISRKQQLIVITHLPQIAAKGDMHFKVKKEENQSSTITKVVQLRKEERIQEIAQLLSGKNISKAAIENAKNLIK